MNLSNLDVRLGVVSSLHEILRRNPPKSNNYKIAEKALDLSLNPSRSAENVSYLRRNVWRDARLLNFRRPDEVSFVEETGADSDWAYFEAPLIDYSTPESYLYAKRLAESVRQQLVSVEKKQCFDCLLEGMTVAETEDVLGISAIA